MLEVLHLNKEKDLNSKVKQHFIKSPSCKIQWSVNSLVHFTYQQY